MMYDYMQNRNCIHHLLMWAVICLVRWCLSLKFSPHTCSGVNFFNTSFANLLSMVYSLMQCNAQGSSFYSLLMVYSLMQCSGVKFFNSLSMVCSAWCNWKVPDNEVGRCFVFSQNCSPPFCCGGSACEKLQYRSNCHRPPRLERMCIVHATKIRGHPEGESALGASVACWKAACWCQAKMKCL